MDAATAVGERRRTFVRQLYGLHYALSAENPRRSAEARRTLARLRRAFAGPRQEAEAYDVVFPQDPPVAEQELWLLVAGLFALHPHGNTAMGRSVGGAMRLLAGERTSAKRRFTQLLSVDPAALPHYLRQAVQLLRADDVALDYHRLLLDLVEMHSSRERAHQVRLRWARDYHRPNRRPNGERTGTPLAGVAVEESAAQPTDTRPGGRVL